MVCKYKGREREYRREYYKKNRKKIIENSQKFRKNNLTKASELQRKWQKANREKKAGRGKSEQCEICGSFGEICYDHDHKTGKFRGWICQRCNTVLGFVKDNKELLYNLIKYLK